jgi:hypothetical protein
MKYVDESTGIDLFAEMERDEKTYLDGKQALSPETYAIIVCNPTKKKLVFLVLKMC